MINQDRTEQGKFLSKSNENRQVRSIRLTDTVWDKLGEFASEQNLTRADYLEKLVEQDMLNLCSGKLKSGPQENSITLSNEAILKLDKIASLRNITRDELIEWLLKTDILEQKIKPVGENQATVTKLAKLLNTDPKTIRDYRDGKRSKTLTEWSQDKTIDGKAWDYDPATKRYFQVD